MLLAGVRVRSSHFHSGFTAVNNRCIDATVTMREMAKCLRFYSGLAVGTWPLALGRCWCGASETTPFKTYDGIKANRQN